MTDTRPSQPCLIPLPYNTHTHKPSLNITHIPQFPSHLPGSVRICLSLSPSCFPHVPSLIIPLPTCPLSFIFSPPTLSSLVFPEVPPIRNALSFLTLSASVHSLPGNFDSPHSLSCRSQRTLFQILWLFFPHKFYLLHTPSAAGLFCLGSWRETWQTWRTYKDRPKGTHPEKDSWGSGAVCKYSIFKPKVRVSVKSQSLTVSTPALMYSADTLRHSDQSYVVYTPISQISDTWTHTALQNMRMHGKGYILWLAHNLLSFDS